MTNVYWRCPECGTFQTPLTHYCGHCGHNMKAERMLDRHRSTWTLSDRLYGAFGAIILVGVLAKMVLG